MISKAYIPAIFLALGFIQTARATTFPSGIQPFSKYGQIQNVQNYSSNPFWNPDSPYNLRIPQAIYAQGTDVDTADCQSIVNALIYTYCMTQNNCLEVSLEDIRPTLMVQLSTLPNHNYVTACAGFIDEAFNDYKEANNSAAPKGNQVVSFPQPTTANPNAGETELNIYNPFAPQVPDWAQEIEERKQELKNLQSQNGAGTERLAKADFPATIADLSFSERVQNAAEGYAPYKGKSAYKQINVVEDSAETVQRKTEYCNQQLQNLAIIEADIATLQNCQKQNRPIADCMALLKGKYL